MKRIKRLTCILLSASMILSATAVCAFGQSIDVENQGNTEGSAVTGNKVKALSYHGRLPNASNALSPPEIRINRRRAKIGRGEKLRLKAFSYPSAAKNKKFRWVSTNQKVAKVSSDGVVKGIRPGRTKIMVASRSNPGARAVCSVTVGYRIKYYTDGGRLARRSPRIYYNERVNLKEPVKNGYEFKGWFTDRNRTKRISYIEKDADKDYTLYAKWEKE